MLAVRQMLGIFLRVKPLLLRKRSVCWALCLSFQSDCSIIILECKRTRLSCVGFVTIVRLNKTYNECYQWRNWSFKLASVVLNGVQDQEAIAVSPEWFTWRISDHRLKSTWISLIIASSVSNMQTNNCVVEGGTPTKCSCDEPTSGGNRRRRHEDRRHKENITENW